jgi:hypothetical protein
MSTERSFFQAMEEFGFLSHIYEKLPPDFTAVFEIARVIEDEDTPLHRQLKDVLALPSLIQSSHRDELVDPHHYVPTGTEYEAELIRSHHDLARVYPNQFMLPEEIFLERLARRELWMPIAKEPKILPVSEVDEGFSFDNKKQKVYILFDTSASMNTHHRIHLAKAILYYFLKKNRAELGHISFRTLDVHVGELHTAVDVESFHALMARVLRITHLGDGTQLQKAILTAAHDIEEMEHLSGAEILVITDGAVALTEEEIRSQIDPSTVIHTIKIGHAQLFATEAQIQDLLTLGPNKDQMLVDLVQQERDIQHHIGLSQGQDKQRGLEMALAGVRRQISERRGKLGVEIQKTYARELAALSRVYIEIDDFNETERFRADAETINDLNELALSLAVEAEEFLTPELTKKVAVLHDHIQFLIKYETDPELLEKLRAIDQQLKKLISKIMGEPGHAEAGESEGDDQGEKTSVQVPLNDEDLRDLRFLLDADLSFGGDWTRIFRWMWVKVKQAFRR